MLRRVVVRVLDSTKQISASHVDWSTPGGRKLSGKIVLLPAGISIRLTFAVLL